MAQLEPGAGSPAGPDAQLLAEIEGLLLASRLAAHGATAGMHRAVRRGTSIEFSEHKLYTPGDDVRHIDWRAWAKTDRFHIKQFEDETNLRVELLVDHSASMDFIGEAPDKPSRMSKLAYAKVLAGALSYLALRQGDATGLTTFATDVDDELPPRATSAHLMEILTRLARLAGGGATGVARCVDRFAQAQRRRTVAVLVTDLFDPSPELESSLRRLSARRHDVAVLHLMDPAEIDFPYENPSTFVSMEDDRRLFVHPRTLRNAYVSEMKKFLADTARFMAECSIDYRLVNTSQDPSLVLAEFLRARERRR